MFSGFDKLPAVPDYDFDQDVDTDEEAYCCSKQQCQDQFEAGMREYLAMGGLGPQMLKNSNVMQRVLNPYMFDSTGNMK